MSLLKVTHVVLSLDVGGMERNVVNQIRQGQRLGQQVSILCVEKPGEMAPRAEALGARVLCVHKRPGLRPRIIRPIRNALRELQPDVIHTHQIAPLLYTGLAARTLSIPLLVHTEHGRMNYAGRWRTRMLGRTAGRFARVFYCLSKDMAEAVARENVVPRHKIRVIMNGIDTAVYRQPCDSAPVRDRLQIPQDVPLVGTVGRLSEVKRQNVLLSAFASLQKDFPTSHLLLVGDGPMRQSLADQAQSLGISDQVHFAGFCADTTPYLHALDVFALPSRSEGMPQALLEACVAEIPVIATRVGGIPEVIEHGVSGFLIEPGDASALARGIGKLLASRSDAKLMAARAASKVIHAFDVARMASDYHRDFVELLGCDRPAREPVAAVA